MKTALRILGATLLFVSCAAGARDERLLLSLENALAAAKAQEQLDDAVQFYWGDQPYPPPVESLEVRTTTRKVYALDKSDWEACSGAFGEALAALRERALELGANAVIEVKSIYPEESVSSEERYACRAGYVMTGVTLEGEIVNLPPPGVTAVRPLR